MGQFSQTRFLGATVTSWTGSIGWGETPSQVVVSLVEDPAIGDEFTPLYVGRPVKFVFGNFSFTGIIQSFKDIISTGGYVHEVVLTDPREILEGCQLILDGYTGSVQNLPNLLNIYGYLESFGFGASQKNDTGIPWTFIRNAIHTLTRSPQQGSFGGPLYFIQSRYIVDLSLLPPLPEDYRVGGDNISILQFISEICEASGCDYYVVMIETTPGIFVIQPVTVSRNSLINYGAVTQFLDSFSQYEGKSVGRELANETAGKFLVGGKKRDLWYQPYDGSINTVWQFWGFDINGNVNIGTGYGDAHQVVLDSRSVNNPRVGPFYLTNVAEIRSVLGGRANWETFLLLNKGNGGIHSEKVDKLNIIGYTAATDPQTLFKEIFEDYKNNGGEVKIDLSQKFFPHKKKNTDDYEQLDMETGYLYDFLYSIATEYYGRKFLVAIPFTQVAEEPDTGKVRLSQLPVESGFIEESIWPNAIINRLLPLEIDKFTEEDGKVVGFVRYNDCYGLDLSELDPESIAFSSVDPQFGPNKLQNYSVFIRCTIEGFVCYLDKNTFYGPRAVITLDAPVHSRIQSNDYAGNSIIAKFLRDGFTSEDIDVSTAEFKTNVMDKLLGSISKDVLSYDQSSSVVTPDLAVVPLESQIEFYGPWSAIGTYGKMEYELDDSLVPWSYAGFTAMNIAAEAKVNQAIGVNQQLEQGEITFPDIPFHQLGQAILAGGPLVSDISCNIGEQGAHTTYTFKRNVKQPRYGQAKAERVAQIARAQQQLRRRIRLFQNRGKNAVDTSRSKESIRPIVKTTHPKKMKTSSHEVLVGQIFSPDSGDITSSIFLQSEYNFINHIKTNYQDKAYSTLDCLFTPYQTNPDDNKPSFVNPVGSSSSPTVLELNPFGSGNNMKMYGGDTQINDLFERHTNQRAIGLRGPVVLSQWGYDTNGKPVPNKSGDGSSSEFLLDYRKKMHKWKTGPIDFRWDEDRGVWAAGGEGGGLIRATMITSSGARLANEGTIVPVSNWINLTISSGDNLFLTLDKNVYYAVNLTHYTASTVTGGSIGCNPDGTFKSCTSTFKVPGKIIPSSQSGCS